MCRVQNHCGATVREHPYLDLPKQGHQRIDVGRCRHFRQLQNAADVRSHARLLALTPLICLRVRETADALLRQHPPVGIPGRVWRTAFAWLGLVDRNDDFMILSINRMLP